MGSKLEDLLQERLDAYARYSDEIMQLISSNVIPAILEMLDLTDQELDKLVWHNVTTQEKSLMLAGTIRYQPGDVITDPDTGDTVTLDEKLAALLDKMVRVAVPLKLAATGSASDILEHFEVSAEKLKEEYETVYGHEPETYDKAVKHAMYGQLGMDFEDDFNYNDLTDEQKESLMLTLDGPNNGDKLN